MTSRLRVSRLALDLSPSHRDAEIDHVFCPYIIDMCEYDDLDARSISRSHPRSLIYEARTKDPLMYLTLRGS